MRLILISSFLVPSIFLVGCGDLDYSSPELKPVEAPVEVSVGTSHVTMNRSVTVIDAGDENSHDIGANIDQAFVSLSSGATMPLSEQLSFDLGLSGKFYQGKDTAIYANDKSWSVGAGASYQFSDDLAITGRFELAKTERTADVSAQTTAGLKIDGHSTETYVSAGVQYTLPAVSGLSLSATYKRAEDNGSSAGYDTIRAGANYNVDLNTSVGGHVMHATNKGGYNQLGLNAAYDMGAGYIIKGMMAHNTEYNCAVTDSGSGMRSKCSDTQLSLGLSYDLAAGAKSKASLHSYEKHSETDKTPMGIEAKF